MPRRLPATKTSHGKVNSHFFSLYRDYSNSLTLSWISINHTQVHEENEFRHCLFTSFTKRKLGIFTDSRAVEGKEMYKKAWCTCKVVVLPYQAIAYLTFSSPPHLKLPIIYDTLWFVKNNILEADWIAPADSIQYVFCDSSIVPSFLVYFLGKYLENISFPCTHKLGKRTGQ